MLCLHATTNVVIFVSMRLSVVILNYNVSYFLEQCILSVQSAIANLDAEIIVVDNNSSDNSVSMIQEKFPNLKFIPNKENVGFPKGNNIAVDFSEGNYVCILNPDTVVAEDTFVKLLHFAESKKNLGIVGCRLIDGAGNFLPESKRGTPTPWVAITKVLGLYKYFPTNLAFNQYYAQHVGEFEVEKVDILVGAFMFLKKEVYQELGGFDENCFMYSDDIDLSYMSLKANLDNYYFPETTVIHYKGESTIKDYTYMKRFQEAMEFFYTKHFKKNFFFSVLMKIGTSIFSLHKKSLGDRSINYVVKSYFFISESETSRQLLEKKLQNSVQQLSEKQLKELISQSVDGNGHTEIIFDNNCVSFSTIIESIQQLRKLGYTFKIMPKGCDFIIGSNNSNDRGEVILIN